MYNPKYIPNLNQELTILKDIRFGIVYRSEFVIPDNTSVEQLHIHGYLEIFFNISSDVSFLVNSNIYPVKHGDVIVSRANDIHMCIYNQTRTHEYICLWIDCPEDSPLLSFSKTHDHSPLFSFNDVDSANLKGLLTSLASACSENRSELEKASLLMQVLLLLDKKGTKSITPSQIPESFQKILDYIDENFADIHFVNDIHEKFFVSPATLNRMFRRHMHVSAKKYIESKRLAHASELLAGGQTVTDVCMSLGFSDCSHFIRLFKKTFGETPFKYKQRFK